MKWHNIKSESINAKVNLSRYHSPYTCIQHFTITKFATSLSSIHAVESMTTSSTFFTILLRQIDVVGEYVECVLQEARVFKFGWPRWRKNYSEKRNNYWSRNCGKGTCREIEVASSNWRLWWLGRNQQLEQQPQQSANVYTSLLLLLPLPDGNAIQRIYNALILNHLQNQLKTVYEEYSNVCRKGILQLRVDCRGGITVLIASCDTCHADVVVL